MVFIFVVRTVADPTTYQKRKDQAFDNTFHLRTDASCRTNEIATQNHRKGQPFASNKIEEKQKRERIAKSKKKRQVCHLFCSALVVVRFPQNLKAMITSWQRHDFGDLRLHLQFINHPINKKRNPKGTPICNAFLFCSRETYGLRCT